LKISIHCLSLVAQLRGQISEKTIPSSLEKVKLNNKKTPNNINNPGAIKKYLFIFIPP